MQIKLKRALLQTAAILLILAGACGAFGLGGLVFDDSYMQTQRALGAPGATTQLWAEFIVCVIVALAGLALLLLGFWRKKPPTVAS